MTPQNFVPAARFSFIVSEQIIYKCTRNVFHIFTLNICILSTSFRMMKRKVIKSLAITVLGWSTVAVVPLRKETDRMPTFYNNCSFILIMSNNSEVRSYRSHFVWHTCWNTFTSLKAEI